MRLKNISFRSNSYVSPAYHSLWGFNSDALYRDPDAWIRSIHPEDREQVQTTFIKNAISGTYDQQYRMIVADGSVHFIHERCFPVRDDQGKVYRLIGIARDMTDQIRMETVLHESQQDNELLGQLIRNSNLAIVIGYPDGSLGLFNPAYEKLTGYSAYELQAIDWSAVLTPPEWRDFELDQLASLQYNDQSVLYEKEYIRKNGSRVPVELLAHLTTDSAGKPLYYYAFITDISARKAAEAALQENEQRMRLATEATGVGIWEWNVQTNQIRWDAQMFHIYGILPTPNGFIDYRIWSEAVLPEDLHQQEVIMQDTIDRRGRSTREFRIHRADTQDCRYIHAVETVRINALGQVEWVVGTNLDVTEQMLHLKALQASETRLALGIQVAGLALVEVDYTTAMTHLSAEAAKLFGLGDTVMVVPRSTVHATFHPDDQSELMRRINESLNPAGDGGFAMDHRVIWPDGTVRWLRVRKQVVFSGEGRERYPVRAILAAHDITGEMTVSEAVRTNEAFVRGVLNSLPEHIVVLDDKGVVSAVNESWERFAVINEGTPSAVSVGANYLEVCRRSSSAGDLYAREALAGLESLLAGSFEEFVMEYPCPTPGNNLWFLLFAKRMIKGHEGIILSHVNITERKQAEDELRNTQARLALVVEEVQAGYWDLNLKTKKLYVSPEWNRQIGYDVNETTHQWQQKDDRLHPDDRDLVATATENFISGRLPVYELDFRLRHKNGSYRWIHSRAALIRDANNQPTRMLGLNLDITDYKRTRELNEQRDKMEYASRLYVASQTAAAIAHEMNQPLTAISYYADVALHLLQTGNENPQKLSRVLESCSQQAQRAGQVIRQLMTVLHKGETLSESIDINSSVLDAIDFLRSNDLLRAVKLELNLASILPPVLANVLQIQKILINLARNSFESIQESGVKFGSVTVTTQIFAGNPDFVQVTVSDNGKGVKDAASLRAMFQPFHTTKATGLGMGLAISRALIEAHGGKMWAEQNPDSGLSVHFTLPVVK